MQLELEIELRKIAKLNNISEEVINQIFSSQFKFLQKSITADSTKTVMLPKIGKFCLSKGKLKNILKHNERNSKEANV